MRPGEMLLVTTVVLAVTPLACHRVVPRADQSVLPSLFSDIQSLLYDMGDTGCTSSANDLKEKFERAVAEMSVIHRYSDACEEILTFGTASGQEVVFADIDHSGFSAVAVLLCESGSKISASNITSIDDTEGCLAVMLPRCVE